MPVAGLRRVLSPAALFPGHPPGVAFLGIPGWEFQPHRPLSSLLLAEGVRGLQDPDIKRLEAGVERREPAQWDELQGRATRLGLKR